VPPQKSKEKISYSLTGADIKLLLAEKLVYEKKSTSLSGVFITDPFSSVFLSGSSSTLDLFLSGESSTTENIHDIHFSKKIPSANGNISIKMP
jgi:hypothetical protein